MRSGMALCPLLRRPAVYVWIPLAGLASLTIVTSVAALHSLLYASLRQLPTNAVLWTFTAFLGLLVGQAVRELQHCRLSWMLPNLRARLLPGVLVVGLLVTMFAREILFSMAGLVWSITTPISASPRILEVWTGLPTPSLGLFALSFLTFWIGVRPSAVNLLGVMVPLVLLGPLLTEVVANHGVSVFLLASPLAGFLMCETFTARSARQRPFIRTQPLAGGPWARSSAPTTSFKSKNVGIGRGTDWKFGRIGKSHREWIRAGWHESHGRWGAIVRFGTMAVPVAGALTFIVMTLDTAAAAPHLWLPLAFGRVPRSIPNTAGGTVMIISGSILVGIPLAVYCACYASISLRQRPSLYPMSRRRLADIEYRGSLAETFVICGFLIAFLLGFWAAIDQGLNGGRLARWPLHLGMYSWAVVLLQPLALIAGLTPLAQYYRLRHLHDPRAQSPVIQLVSVFALTALLVVVGIWATFSIANVLRHMPIAVHAAALATVPVVSQYIYRRKVDRYFRQADLV